MEYWPARSQPDMASVWVLLDEHWVSDEDEHYEGTSLIGIFSSREAALFWYADECVGPERAARIDWSVAEHNPGSWTGWDPISDRPILHLVRTEVRTLPLIQCCICQAPVDAEATAVRLRLCRVHAMKGSKRFCEGCGHNWPEHGPNGLGCAHWMPEDLEGD